MKHPGSLRAQVTITLEMCTQHCQNYGYQRPLCAAPQVTLVKFITMINTSVPKIIFQITIEGDLGRTEKILIQNLIFGFCPKYLFQTMTLTTPEKKTGGLYGGKNVIFHTYTHTSSTQKSLDKIWDVVYHSIIETA